MKSKVSKIFDAGSDDAQSKKVRADRQRALATVLRTRRGKQQYQIINQGKVEKSNILSAKKRERIGHWNVRTLYSTGKAFCLTKELKRLKVRICGISETHWTGQGKMSVNGYTIWYSGKLEGKHE